MRGARWGGKWAVRTDLFLVAQRGEGLGAQRDELPGTPQLLAGQIELKGHEMQGFVLHLRPPKPWPDYGPFAPRCPAAPPLSVHRDCFDLAAIPPSFAR